MQSRLRFSLTKSRALAQNGILNIQISQGDFMLSTVLLVLLILLVIGALPTWPYSREWGYHYSGIFGLILVILLILVLLGRL
jgi:uncharacterized protein DUF3309